LGSLNRPVFILPDRIQKTGSGSCLKFVLKEHLEEQGLSGAGAAQIAAHRTRDAKVALTAAEMLARHRELAAQFGNQADRIVAEARERGHSRDPQSQEESAKRAQEAVTYARDKNLEREAVADGRDLIRDAVKRASGKATYRDVRADFETRRRSGEFLEMPATKGSAAHRFTTPGMREYEREIIRYLESGKGGVQPILNRGQAELIDEKWADLNANQRTAVKEVLTRHDAHIYTNDAEHVGEDLSREVSKSAAVESQDHGHEHEESIGQTRPTESVHDYGMEA
jgi:hypothetical protein